MSKFVQKNLKISKNYFFSPKKSGILKEEKNFSKKKSSLFLNIRNTQFDQSSLVQPSPVKKILENLEKSLKKNSFFKESENFDNIFFGQQKMLLS